LDITRLCDGGVSMCIVALPVFAAVMCGAGVSLAGVSRCSRRSFAPRPLALVRHNHEIGAAGGSHCCAGACGYVCHGDALALR